MRVRRLLWSTVAAFLVAGSASLLTADPLGLKYLVNHKGDWICVDFESVDTHVDQHGDSTDWEEC